MKVSLIKSYLIQMLLVVITLFGTNGFSQESLALYFQIEGLENDTLVIGYHLGKKQYILDTLLLDDKGSGNYQNDSVPGGLYLGILPDKSFFEFVIAEPKIDLKFDVNDIVPSMKVKHSLENETMYNDLKFIRPKRDAAQKISNELKALENDTSEIVDANKIESLKNELRAFDEEVKQYRNQLIEENDKLFYTRMLKALTDIELPDSVKEQSIEKRRSFYKDHYFDHLDLNDNRFIRTPTLEARYESYFGNLFVQSPDTLIPAINNLLERVSSNKEMFQYTLSHLVNKYSTSKTMGLDAVFVYLVDNYYNNGKAFWADSVSLYRIKTSADMIRPSLIGKRARNFILEDTIGTKHKLYDIENDYTLLYFWDPDCGHCKKSTPVLKKVGEELTDEFDFKIIAICTEHEDDKWKKYLKKNPSDWIHLSDTKFKSRFRQDYNINGTPRIFILDKDKMIIAKRLGAESVSGFMRGYRNLMNENE